MIHTMIINTKNIQVKIELCFVLSKCTEYACHEIQNTKRITYLFQNLSIQVKKKQERLNRKKNLMFGCTVPRRKTQIKTWL